MENTQTLKLYMMLLGCKPDGRHTEQHDVFFGIAASPKGLVPELLAFWPETNGKLHVDAWREVNYVDGFDIRIVDKVASNNLNPNTLFFVNLGGYIKNVFAEQHYMMLSVTADKASAIANAKNTTFYGQVGFKGAPSHIDDQYAIDVDDLYAIEDILSPSQKNRYSIAISPNPHTGIKDKINLGYFMLNKLP